VEPESKRLSRRSFAKKKTKKKKKRKSQEKVNGEGGVWKENLAPNGNGGMSEEVVNERATRRVQERNKKKVKGVGPH